MKRMVRALSAILLSSLFAISANTASVKGLQGALSTVESSLTPEEALNLKNVFSDLSQSLDDISSRLGETELAEKFYAMCTQIQESVNQNRSIERRDIRKMVDAVNVFELDLSQALEL